jgi:hypothetical protein
MPQESSEAAGLLSFTILISAPPCHDVLIAKPSNVCNSRFTFESNNFLFPVWIKRFLELGI